jgi:hypothetical protein
MESNLFIICNRMVSDNPGFARPREPRDHLPLAALISPEVFILGPVEVERVSAGLVALPRASQHARDFLGMNWQDEATIRARR